MEKVNFAKYLDNLGIQANTWIRWTNLNYIILESDANQFYNPLTQKIYLDTTNGLIKIKYSPLQPITGSLKPFTYNKKHKTIFIQNGPTTVYDYKKIREPKIGDYLGVFCTQTDDTITSSLITDVKNSYSGTQITVSDDKIFNKIELQKIPMKFFIILQGINHFVELNNEYELYEEPITDDSYADIYIDITRIIGFDFDMKWRPNNV